jgi:glycosyltransferase involved in cell wall biosynthesis
MTTPCRESKRRDGKRIALLADHIVSFGGSEQVFLYMAEEFAEADVITLAYNPEKTLPEFSGFAIRTSWANRLFSSHRRFKLLFPIAALVMEYWRLKGYDLVISSSASTAKYIKVEQGRHLSYCYFPTRALWNPGGYFAGSGFIYKVFKFLLPILQRRDRAAAARVDRFVAISRTSQQEIKKIYQRDAEVVFSPIPVERFRAGLQEEKQDFFLIVSRLDHWKRLDYAIEAFNRLGLPLRVIGVGDCEAELRAKAKDNIVFLGRLPLDEVIRHYGQARAAIFTPALEYGLVPIEANAAGTPAIAFGFGGVKETMIGLEEAQARNVSPTAVLFEEQTPEALMAAVRTFETLSFDRNTLSAHAEQFGVPIFQRKLRAIAEEMLREA